MEYVIRSTNKNRISSRDEISKEDRILTEKILKNILDIDDFVYSGYILMEGKGKLAPQWFLNKKGYNLFIKNKSSFLNENFDIQIWSNKTLNFIVDNIQVI